MILIQSVDGLHKALTPFRTEGKALGFVPTMGALHAGHISLVKKCKEDNDICVVSIFVNPTQFNDKSDLDKYPRTLDADCALLATEGVDIVFAPSVDEIYPEPDTREFDFGLLDKVMEAAHRPGHFNGVAQIVSRLFSLVQPTRAYFGEKDFQQVAIVKAMVKKLGIEIEILTLPIIRENTGLAMSSRNERLTVDQRLLASKISAVLNSSLHTGLSVKDTLRFVNEGIGKEAGLSIEYFDIVDGDSLQSISDWQDSSYAVGCIAVFCGDVRLIDNITYCRK